MHTHRSDEGATAVEYALMIGLIAFVIIAAVTLFGVNVLGLFTPMANSGL
jgi:pilus assembly protein Flp/PilA